MCVCVCGGCGGGGGGGVRGRERCRGGGNAAYKLEEIQGLSACMCECINS